MKIIIHKDHTIFVEYIHAKQGEINYTYCVDDTKKPLLAEYI